MADLNGAATPVGADQRGKLEIHSRALHTIANAAARATAGVTPTRAGLGGLAGRRLPRAEVTIDGVSARARVTIAVAWPTPIAPVAAAVRAAVADDLQALCGYTADRVDVDVRCVGPDSATQPRRVR